MRDRTDASGEQVFPRERARSTGATGETISPMSDGGFPIAEAAGRRPAHGKARWSARCPETVPQRTEMIESPPGNSMAAKHSSYKIWGVSRRFARPVEPVRRQISSSVPARCGKDGAQKEFLSVIGVTH
jgi:hypothetical protein